MRSIFEICYYFLKNFLKPPRFTKTQIFVLARNYYAESFWPLSLRLSSSSGIEWYICMHVIVLSEFFFLRIFELFINFFCLFSTRTGSCTTSSAFSEQSPICPLLCRIRKQVCIFFLKVTTHKTNAKKCFRDAKAQSVDRLDFGPLRQVFFCWNFSRPNPSGFWKQKMVVFFCLFEVAMGLWPDIWSWMPSTPWISALCSPRLPSAEGPNRKNHQNITYLLVLPNSLPFYLFIFWHITLDNLH